MTMVVDGLVRVIYYAITIPVCVIVLAFWLIRLVITVAVMVFVMLIEAWGKGAASSRALNVIDRVKEVGPNTVATLLSYRGAVRSQEGSGRGDFLYELAYTIVFLGAIVLLFVFKGYMESFGRAIEAPAALFSDNGLAAKLGLAYVIGSFFFAAYLITRQDPEDRSALMNFFVPIYLLVSGAALVFSGYLALGHMR